MVRGLDQIWSELNQGIQHIFDGQSMSKRRYIDLYTLVHEYYTRAIVKEQESGDNVSTPSKSTNREDAEKMVAKNCQELYNKLKELLRNHLVEVLKPGVDYMDESVLRFYTEQWEGFQFSCKVIHGLCSYLNRSQHFKAAVEVSAVP